MQVATLLAEPYEPREEFDPTELKEARSVTVWYSPAIARWRLERQSASQLVDGAALETIASGSTSLLAGEIFAAQGDGVIVQPADLRVEIAERAHALQKQLKLKSSKRAKTSSRSKGKAKAKAKRK